MKLIVAGLVAAVAVAASVNIASAQVAPRWNYSGSAVCPEGHDYSRGACWPRGYGRYRESFGRGSAVVRPRWTPSGSAVCPENFDYLRGACRSRY
jgi:hypothetical protein